MSKRFGKRKYASLGDDDPLSHAMIPLKARRKASSKGVRSKTAATASLSRQVRALIAGKKRDSALVTGINDVTLASATVSACITSSDTGGGGVAGSASGLLFGDSDSALINYVHLKGNFRTRHQNVTIANMASTYPPRCRMLLAWYYKPLLVADASGTLPLVTEVLTSDAIDAMVLPSTANSGRFAVMFDKTYTLSGNRYVIDTTATQSYALAAESTMPSIVHFDEVIKINKKCHFAANADSATPAGHYDSDVNAGRVDKGLGVIYFLYDTGAGVSGLAAQIDSTNRMRTNYTM